MALTHRSEGLHEIQPRVLLQVSELGPVSSRWSHDVHLFDHSSRIDGSVEENLKPVHWGLGIAVTADGSRNR